MRIPGRRRPARRPPAGSRLLFAASIVMIAATPVTDVPPPPAAELAAALARIQNSCFAAYPPGLVRRMSGRDGPVPDEVRTDPRQQNRYFKTEERVSKGLFYPSLLEDLLPAFSQTVTPGIRFLDLGSGDGRVVFMASLLGARAEGVEYDRGLHRIALAVRDDLGGLIDPERAVLRRGDFFKEDLRPYRLFFYFEAGSTLEDRLLDKLRSEMTDDAVLILAYPRGPIGGFIRVANHAGVEVLRRDPSYPRKESSRSQ